MIQTSWDLSGRDVVPDLRISGSPNDVGAAMLYAMVMDDQIEWAPPYDAVRQRLSIRKKQIVPELQKQADSRYRTYMTLFRGLGLVSDEDRTLKRTAVGARIGALLKRQLQLVDDFGYALTTASRGEVAHLVAPMLARYQLSNPRSAASYPAGTDIRPLLAIWKAMRSLDDKLHWEELGRVLTTCLQESELSSKIAIIKQARRNADYDPKSTEVMTRILGPRQPDLGVDQSDRLDTWFSRAGFKDLFLEPRDRTDGYRHLNAEYIPVIDAILDDPPVYNTTESASEYERWLGSVGGDAPMSSSDSVGELDARILDRVRRHGSSHIIALVGVAGTGKTSAAHRAATTLTAGDNSRVSTVQFHAAFTYEDFVGGLAPSGEGFEPREGVLVSIADRAAADPDNVYVLVVDELSRADTANVLGELLTYIEYRHRPFEVPALGREVQIPDNLVIIATMNPADRSVIALDDALVRRLRQIPVNADANALDKILAASGMESPLRDSVVEWFSALPDDSPFGHGVFVGASNENDLRELWDESLRHFLRRGNVTVYPDAEKVERGYSWRHWHDQMMNSSVENAISRAVNALPGVE
nr:AAA family ATPase [uncultured Microbacterium sp.]